MNQSINQGGETEAWFETAAEHLKVKAGARVSLPCKPNATGGIFKR